MTNRHIGFIGGGNMAQAIGRGLVAGQPDVSLTFVEPAAAQRETLARLFPDASVAPGPGADLARCDAIVLAVKPDIIKPVCESLAGVLGDALPLIVSVAAGVRIASMNRWLGGDAVVVRAMPNQPALTGHGMTALVAGSSAGDEARATATRVLAATGAVLWLSTEDEMDAVTAISGSGPAYFYRLMEIMIDVAVEFGFSAADARELVVTTAAGAAAVAGSEAEPLRVLRERVTSPGGTTAAALQSLENDGIHAIVRAALQRARERSRELAQTPGRDQ